MRNAAFGFSFLAFLSACRAEVAPASPAPHDGGVWRGTDKMPAEASATAIAHEGEAIAPDDAGPVVTPPSGEPAGVPVSPPDAAAPPTAISRSAGCGMPRMGTSSYVEQPRISVAGLQRHYYLYVPRTYDPNRAYPLIFRWHGAGDNALHGGMPIEASVQEDAIIVAADGHDVPRWGNGWDFTEKGPDVALFDALVDGVSKSHCIDRQRIFSYGFSMGGGFSLILGCVRGEVLRGIGVVEGGWLAPTSPPGQCSGHVAAWIAQGTADNTVTVADAVSIRNSVYLPQQGCNQTTQAVEPPPCRSNDGCLAGYPQVYCLTNAGHDPQPGFAPPAAWAFFRSLSVVDVP